jgi:hypothetical protein
LAEATRLRRAGSWVASIIGALTAGSGRSGGVAIGDRILDLPAALGLGLLDGPARAAAEAAAGEALKVHPARLRPVEQALAGGLDPAPLRTVLGQEVAQPPPSASASSTDRRGPPPRPPRARR